MAAKDLQKVTAMDKISAMLRDKMVLDERSDNTREDTEKQLMIQRIKQLLTTYDYPGNWVLDQEALEKTGDTVYLIMGNKLSELDPGEESCESEVRNNALIIIGMKFVKAFLGIYLMKVDMDQHVMEVEDFIGKCWEDEYFEPLYFPGIVHAFRGLQALLVTKLTKTSFTRIEEVLSELDQHEELDDLGKVGLLAVHSQFIGELYTRSYKEQGKLIQKMIALEPSSAQWVLWLYNIRRFARREIRTSSPGMIERTLIVDAAALDPDNPLVIISLCDTIAEVLKHHGDNWTGVEDFGSGRVFTTSQEMVEYLKTATREALVFDSTSIRTNMAASQIFCAVVPHKFRDYKFAKVCIDRALHFHPNSSRANHRNGIHYLMVEKNPVQAIVYFERAVECDRRNFPAFSDLIQTYFHDHETNSEKIEKLFATEFVDLSEGNIGRHYFMKGVYLFMQNAFLGAINAWITAVKEKNWDMDGFKQLPYMIRRHHWPNDVFSADAVLYQLNLALKTVSVENQETLRKIMSVLHPEEGKHGRSRQRDASYDRHLGSPPKHSSNWRGGRRRNSGTLPDPSYSKNSGSHAVGNSGSSSSNGKKSNISQNAGQQLKQLGQHYETLGLKRGASIIEIKRAYTKLCQKYRVDGSVPLAGVDREHMLEVMKEINQAYDVLVNSF